MGYELVGGIVEEGEEPAAYAAREAVEESGWRPVGEPEHLIVSAVSGDGGCAG
ncbi:MAG TPA: NUDIX domain-containing protein [Mycobacteriales bacterium]|nr:NUDIX domain-containing protein [Mycobacteriales bacterium]